MQGLDNGSLACRVGAEEQCDGFQFHPHRLLCALEVLNGDGGDRPFYIPIFETENNNRILG